MVKKVGKIIKIMKTYTFYKRRNLLKENETAWQIDTGNGLSRRVLFASSYKRDLSLDQVAGEAAAEALISKMAIRASDKLTTIPAPVLVPGNRYIDEPLMGQQLIEFWKKYEQVIESHKD